MGRRRGLDQRIGTGIVLGLGFLVPEGTREGGRSVSLMQHRFPPFSMMCCFAAASSLPKLALGAAAALTAISLSPGSAQAYVVTVGGAQYDLSTYTFTPNQYNANKTFYDAIFQAQPWYGNYNATYSFGQVITQSIWNALYPVSAIQAGSPVDGYFNANIGITSLVPTALNMMTGSANGSGTLAGCLDLNPVTCLGPGNSGYNVGQYSAFN